MNDKCPKGCVYSCRDHGTFLCQYILVTGHRRPCPPGKGCTVYEQGKRRLPKPVAPAPRKQSERRQAQRHLTHEELTAQAGVLRELRKDAGLTQPEAARAAGVSRPTYQRWEQGRYAANWKLLEGVFPGGAEQYEKRRKVAP